MWTHWENLRILPDSADQRKSLQSPRVRIVSSASVVAQDNCNKPNGHVQTLKSIDDRIFAIISAGGRNADPKDELSSYNTWLTVHRNGIKEHDESKTIHKQAIADYDRPVVDSVYGHQLGGA